MPAMGPPEGKILTIDIICQKRLNTIKKSLWLPNKFQQIRKYFKKNMNFWVCFKKLVLGSLESPLGGYSLWQHFGFVVEKLFKCTV